MIRRPPRSTPLYSSAASDVYKRQQRPIACITGTLLLKRRRKHSRLAGKDQTHAAWLCYCTVVSMISSWRSSSRSSNRGGRQELFCPGEPGAPDLQGVGRQCQAGSLNTEATAQMKVHRDRDSKEPDRRRQAAVCRPVLSTAIQGSLLVVQVWSKSVLQRQTVAAYYFATGSGAVTSPKSQ